MSLLTDLKARLRSEEGTRYTAYRDSLGHLTIGDGFNLERPDADRLLLTLGLSPTAVRAGAWRLNATQVEYLLDYTAQCALTDAGDVVGKVTWQTLPYEAKLALGDMCFQLGAGGLDQFQRMLAAIRNIPPDWLAVEREANDSLWDKQTPARADGVELLFHSLVHPDIADADRARVVALFMPDRPAASAHASDDDPPPAAA